MLVSPHLKTDVREMSKVLEVGTTRQCHMLTAQGPLAKHQAVKYLRVNSVA